MDTVCSALPAPARAQWARGARQRPRGVRVGNTGWGNLTHRPRPGGSSRSRGTFKGDVNGSMREDGASASVSDMEARGSCVACDGVQKPSRFPSWRGALASSGAIVLNSFFMTPFFNPSSTIFGLLLVVALAYAFQGGGGDNALIDVGSGGSSGYSVAKVQVALLGSARFIQVGQDCIAQLG
mmetsp:Transcript_553/g.1279  ORF Transcript_553/g.1279 Transcript_553/m.1279 type:complete len:182 (-) Transcript_553:666-1211(-)